MDAHYLAILKLAGFRSLDSADPSEILTMPEAGVRAVVTADVEKYCAHIDRAQAALAFVANGPTTDENSWLNRKIEEYASIRRRTFGSGVYLVFEGHSIISEMDLSVQRHFEGFSFALDAISTDTLRAKFQAQLDSAIAAASLEIDDMSDHRINSVGRVIFLTSTINAEPSYCFNAYGGEATAYIIPPLRDEAIGHIKQRAPHLAADVKLVEIFELLSESLNSNTHHLRAFVTAWAAFEIFVKSKSKGLYCKDKHGPGLRGRFRCIASLLRPTALEDEINSFTSLYEARNNLFHNGNTPELPTSAVQKMLKRYLALYLDYTHRT